MKKNDKRFKYPLDLKLKVISYYERGRVGYIRTARAFNVPRDTAREWILNQDQLKEEAMKKNKNEKNEKSKDEEIDYEKSIAEFWKRYAKKLEKEIDEKKQKKFQMQIIVQLKLENPKLRISKLCKKLEIPRSSFYYLKQNKNVKASKDKEVLQILYKLSNEDLKKRGSKSKSKKLKVKFGITVNHKRMARICKENGFLAKNRVRKFPKDYYARQKENKENLPNNILDRIFTSDEPLKKLATDVSYFKVREGWLYFSPIFDHYNNKIVVYEMSRHNDEKLVMKTLDKLFEVSDLTGCLLHSDQGSVYTANEYRERLEKNGIIQSMSRKGNCWDNACMEHFFGTLKVESGYNDLLKTGVLSYKKTKKLIDNFINYYNNERIQKNLGWNPPANFTK